MLGFTLGVMWSMRLDKHIMTCIHHYSLVYYYVEFVEGGVAAKATVKSMKGIHTYLRLLIFLPAILIPACASSSPAFVMMYSAYKLNCILYYSFFKGLFLYCTESLLLHRGFF